MQKTKKQILGIAGLLAVGIMTTVACSIPVPDAAAVSSVDINVHINEGDTRITLLSPLDESSFIESDIEVSSSYEGSDRLEYYLSYMNSDGSEEEVLIKETSVSDATGTYSFSLNMRPYGYRDFKLRAVAYGPNNTIRDDTVAFSYRAIMADFDQGTKENGDPILKVEANESVEKVRVQAYGKDDKPLFVNADGEDEYIFLNRSDFDPTTGELIRALPFEKYGAKAEKYTVVLTAYNGDDNILSMVTLSIDYEPSAQGGLNTPETPNTGSSLFGSLNISRFDYVLTGLIAFSLVVGFAVYLVGRKNRR